MQANNFAARLNIACVICLLLVGLIASQALAVANITAVNVLNKPDRVVISVQGDAPLSMNVLNSKSGYYLGFQFQGRLVAKGRLVGIHSGKIANVRYSRFRERPPSARFVVNTFSHLDYSTQWNDDKTQVEICVWKFGASPAAQAPALPKPVLAVTTSAPAATEPLPVLPPIEIRTAQGSDSGKPAAQIKPVIKVKSVTTAPKHKAAPMNVVRIAPPPNAGGFTFTTSTPAASGAGKQVSLSFLGAEISDVLKALAVQSGENIVVGSDVTGSITVTLDSVTVEEALDYITQLTGYTYVKDQHTYLVGSSETVGGMANAKVEIVTLSYTNADDVLEMLKTQCPQIRASKISVRGGLARKHDQTFEQGKAKTDAQGKANINSKGKTNVNAQGQANVDAQGKENGKDKSASGDATVGASGDASGSTVTDAQGSMNMNSKMGHESLSSGASKDSPSSNMIALVGKEEKLATAKVFIAQIEDQMKNQSGDKKVSVYSVKYVNTQELANTIMSLAIGVTITLAPSDDSAPGSGEAADSKRKIIPLSLLSDEATNRAFDTENASASHTLIIVGKASDVQKALEMAAQFDVPGETDLTTYKVKYVEINLLAKTIRKLVPGVTVEGMNVAAESEGSSGGGAGASGNGGSSTLRSSGEDQNGIKQQTFMNAAAVDNLSRMLVITGRKGDVEKAKALIEALDVKSPQIKIEAKITSLTETGEKKLGLSWNWGNFSKKEISTGHDGHWARQPIDFGATLDALVTNGDGTLLAAPNLVCLEGKPGQFFVGDQIRYIIMIQQTPQGNNVQTATADVGIQLSVVGNVNSDGYITLNLHPEVSKLTLTKDKEAGITLPTITRRFTDHVVRVKSGETIVIGGLIKDDDMDALSKIPILGDIPVLGHLFRHKDKTKDHSEVVIFITASILAD